MNPFSYKEYTNIINKLLLDFPILSYTQAKTKNNFCILRHDVEFSVERAYNLALLEKSLGVKSTYFFQIRNNCYNVFSQKNINLIKKIHSMGHDIGYHAHMGGLKNINNIKNYIIQDCKVMGDLLDLPIEVFSFHRPKKEYLKLNLKFSNLINAYQDEYFTFTEDLNLLDVLYMADSNHKWKWGNPLKKNLKNWKKIQILTHPFSWTKEGYNNRDNYKQLLEEKDWELRKSINQEISNFEV